MNIEKFRTEEVELYEEMKELNEKLEKLCESRDFVYQNYDTTIEVSVKASSYHNYNEKNRREIELDPLDVIGYKLDKGQVIKKLNSKIERIKSRLNELANEFDKIHQSKSN